MTDEAKRPPELDAVMEEHYSNILSALPRTKSYVDRLNGEAPPDPDAQHAVTVVDFVEAMVKIKADGTPGSQAFMKGVMFGMLDDLLTAVQYYIRARETAAVKVPAVSGIMMLEAAKATTAMIFIHEIISHDFSIDAAIDCMAKRYNDEALEAGFWERNKEGLH